MEKPKSPIEKACDLVGSQAEMSRILVVAPAMVNQWVKGLRPVAAEHCKAIAKATGNAISCRDLRPNDWQKFWPELATKEAA